MEEGQQVGKWIEEIEGIERDQATSTWKYLALQLLIGRVEWVKHTNRVIIEMVHCLSARPPFHPFL